MRLDSILSMVTASATAGRQSQGQPARVTTRLTDLLADPAVDAIYIATPHSHHGEYVRAALLAGKPVLCEKPLVTSLEEGQALIELARDMAERLLREAPDRAERHLARWLGSREELLKA